MIRKIATVIILSAFADLVAAGEKSEVARSSLTSDKLEPPVSIQQIIAATGGDANGDGGHSIFGNAGHGIANGGAANIANGNGWIRNKIIVANGGNGKANGGNSIFGDAGHGIATGGAATAIGADIDSSALLRSWNPQIQAVIATGGNGSANGGNSFYGNAGSGVAVGGSSAALGNGDGAI